MNSQVNHLKAKLKWLECKEVCLSGGAGLNTHLTFTQNYPKENHLYQKYWHREQSKYPAEPTLQASAVYNKETMTISTSNIHHQHTNPPQKKHNNKQVKEVYFFIDQPGVLQHSPLQKYTFFKDHLTLDLPLDINSNTQKGYMPGKKISGYLGIYKDNNDVTVYSLEADLKKAEDHKILISSAIIILLAMSWYFYKRASKE